MGKSGRASDHSTASGGVQRLQVHSAWWRLDRRRFYTIATLFIRTETCADITEFLPLTGSSSIISVNTRQITSRTTPDYAQRVSGVRHFLVLSGFILRHVTGDGRPSARSLELSDEAARVDPSHASGHDGARRVLVLAAASATHLRIDATTAHLGDLGANLLLIHAWGATSALSWNQPSWSISAEWFAYLLFPVMLAAALRCRSRPLVLVTIAVAWR